jgi:hypothetical protein
MSSVTEPVATHRLREPSTPSGRTEQGFGNSCSPRGGLVQYLGSSYSLDGTMITFGRKPETAGTGADVFVMRVAGTHMRHVTRTVLYDSYADWGSRS